MDIERARTFLEIVHTGSFQSAAKVLHVTQTTVSARVRALEEELGRQLFVRNRSGASLTPAGEEFHRYAQSFVQLWEHARHQLALPEGRDFVVSIGGELSLWRPLLLDWLVSMHNSRPEIAVRAHVALPDRLVEQVHTGVLDLAITYSPRLEPGLAIEKILEEKLVLVRTTTIGSGHYVYVNWGQEFATFQQSRGWVSSDPDLYVNLGPLGLSYILRVGGYGYFRERVVAEHVESGELELVPDAPEFSYPAYAVTTHGAMKSDVVRLSLDCLREIAQTG